MEKKDLAEMDPLADRAAALRVARGVLRSLEEQADTERDRLRDVAEDATSKLAALGFRSCACARAPSPSVATSWPEVEELVGDTLVPSSAVSAGYGAPARCLACRVCGTHYMVYGHDKCTEELTWQPISLVQAVMAASPVLAETQDKIAAASVRFARLEREFDSSVLDMVLAAHESGEWLLNVVKGDEQREMGEDEHIAHLAHYLSYGAPTRHAAT